MKVHYTPAGEAGVPAACAWTLGFLPPEQYTDNPEHVTCAICRRRMYRYAVTHPREAYPEIPTLPVVAVGAGWHVAVCPLCGEELSHGPGPGHRASHCGCWSKGYYLGDPLPGAMPLDTDIPRGLLKQAHALARERRPATPPLGVPPPLDEPIEKLPEESE